MEAFHVAPDVVEAAWIGAVWGCLQGGLADELGTATGIPCRAHTHVAHPRRHDTLGGGLGLSTKPFGIADQFAGRMFPGIDPVVAT